MAVSKELRDTLVLSFSFLFVFAAYMGIQNLQSSLNQEAGLGIISLSCLYGSIIVSGVFSPTVIGVVGTKTTLVVAWVLHLLYTASNFYPTWLTLVPTSVFLGALSGPLWTAQSVYVAANSTTYSKRTGKALHEVLSKFNGIFFMLFGVTQIFGNLLSSTVFFRSHYEALDNSSQVCGAGVCSSAQNGSLLITEPEAVFVYALLGVFLGLDVVGLVLIIGWLPPLPKQRKARVVQLLVACVRTCVTDLNMLMLVPLFLFQAMEQAFLFTQYTKVYVSCALGIKMVGYCMAVFGTSVSLFSLLQNRLAALVGRYVMHALAAVIHAAIFLTVLLWQPSSGEFFLFFLIPGLWGVVEAVWLSQTVSLVPLLFPKKQDSAFANLHTWKATGFTVFFVYSNFACVRTQVYITVSLLVLAFSLYSVVELRVRLQSREPSASVDEKHSLPNSAPVEKTEIISATG